MYEFQNAGEFSEISDTASLKTLDTASLYGPFLSGYIQADVLLILNEACWHIKAHFSLSTIICLLSS